ncbi:MAG: ATP-dependent zinc metalloprotease FtsH, partial [Fimbriiglobus sp.]
IRMATRTARLMVTQYGMSDRLGPVCYRQADEHVFLGKEMHEGRDFSEGTARIIDEEILRIVLEAEQRAAALLANNRDLLEKLTAALIAHEELDREAVDRVLRGLPPFPASSTPPPPTPEAAAEPPVVVSALTPGLPLGGA